MAGVRQGGQRSFLGVYDKLLKTMQMDYARFDRFEASGYAEFAGKLYTLNSNMFQNAAFCDRMLTQMILHFITWYQDPGLQLVVGPGAAWHVHQDYGTQRFGDALYVTWAAPDAPVKVGERIVRVNGQTLAELRPEVERTLWTTIEPADPEREDWSVVLAFAKTLGVVGADGAERTEKLDQTSGDAAWAKAATGKDPAGEEAPVEPAVEETAHPCCEVTRRGDVCVLALRDAADPAFGTALAACLDEARGADRLVIDVRGCRGGGIGEVAELVPLVLAPGVRIASESLFGMPGIVMNYSRHNVDDQLEKLAALRTPEGSESEPTFIDELEAELRERRGKGLVRDTSYTPEDLYLHASYIGTGEPGRRVAVLADRFTGEAAELLVRAAKAAGFATVMGRATLGSLDNTCPRIVRLDEDYTLIVPTATYIEALDGTATLGRGIAPDVHLAWTPEQLEHDAELEVACAEVSK